jgi:hypothetical protein
VIAAPVTLANRPVRPAAAKAAGDGASSGDAVAAQHQAFDLAQAEAAELQRELAALDAMMMAQLKNEDEILKKWIALI